MEQTDKYNGMTVKPKYLENERFWELSTSQLRFIIGDCRTAMKAYPENPKCIHGPGNYADQINDAATILAWRKETI